MKHEVVQLKDRPLPSLFSWSWLCTFRGDCLPYINPVTSPAFSRSEIDWEHMCVEKRKGWKSGGSSSDRLAQQIACQHLIWKMFRAIPVMCFSASNATYCAPIGRNSSHTNGTKTLDKTSSLIWIFFVMHNSFFNNAKCAQPWHALRCHMALGSQLVKRQTKLSVKPRRIGEKGSYLDEWAWSCWQRQKPVRWERRGLLFSSAQRWHWGHRGQHDPCDLHVIPLYNRHC